MRFFDSADYIADRQWERARHPEIDATVRLHWTDQPYVWHINDGTEVFVVLHGADDMHYREKPHRARRTADTRPDLRRRSQRRARCSPAPEAHILVIEGKGSV